ncbi:hypothetical protein ABW19_dt0202408 [Dactylella cylindrospora]|nr:hypothetical protein ABW19_dt0202408 [Dactylella cylindrospora]
MESSTIFGAPSIPKLGGTQGPKYIRNTTSHTSSDHSTKAGSLPTPTTSLEAPVAESFRRKLNLSDLRPGDAYYDLFIYPEYEPQVNTETGKPIGTTTSDHSTAEEIKNKYPSVLFQGEPIRHWALRDVVEWNPTKVREREEKYKEQLGVPQIAEKSRGSEIEQIKPTPKKKRLPINIKRKRNKDEVLDEPTAKHTRPTGTRNWYTRFKGDFPHIEIDEKSSTLHVPTFRATVHALIYAGKSKDGPQDVNTCFIRAVQRCEDSDFRALLVEKLRSLTQGKGETPVVNATPLEHNPNSNAYNLAGTLQEASGYAKHISTGPEIRTGNTERTTEAEPRLQLSSSQDETLQHRHDRISIVLENSNSVLGGSRPEYLFGDNGLGHGIITRVKDAEPRESANDALSTIFRRRGQMLDINPLHKHKASRPQSPHDHSSGSSSTGPSERYSTPRSSNQDQVTDRPSTIASEYQTTCRSTPTRRSSISSSHSQSVYAVLPCPNETSSHALDKDLESIPLGKAHQYVNSPIYEIEKKSKMRTMYLLLQLISMRQRVIARMNAYRMPCPNGQGFPTQHGPHDGNGNSTSGSSSMGFVTATNWPSGEISFGRAAKRHYGSGRDNEEDDEDEQRPYKRSKGPDLNSFDRSFACPFAKIAPLEHLKCLALPFENLELLKSHLSWVHFKDQRPEGLLEATSWQKIFDLCNHDPAWEAIARTRPNPYFDVLELYLNFLRYGHPDYPGNGPVDFQRLVNPADESSDVVPAISQYPNENVTGDESQTPAGGLSQGPVPASPEAAAAVQRSNQDSWVLDGRISRSLPNAVNKVSGPHIETPLSTEDMNMWGEQIEYFREQGFDFESNNPELYFEVMSALDPHRLIFRPETGYTIPHLEYIPPAVDTHSHQSLQLSQGTLGSNMYDQSIASITNLPSFGTGTSPWTASLKTPQNANTVQGFRFPNLGQAGPVNQAERSGQAQVAHSKSTVPRKYTLIVARRHVDHGSKEDGGFKKYAFDDPEDLAHDFEGWLRTNFFDPLFNWGNMELYHENRNARLGDVERVIMELEGYFAGTEKTKTTLYIVWRQGSEPKGKAKEIEA